MKYLTDYNLQSIGSVASKPQAGHAVYYPQETLQAQTI